MEAPVTPPVYSAVLADDVDDLRFLVRLALEGSGRFRVVAEAADGQEAVDVASEIQPDVMLLDISMPKKDGLEALPEIVGLSPSTKVVVLSGFDADRLEATTKALGASAYIEKGVPPDQLVAAVLQTLEPSERVTISPALPDPRPTPSLSGEELLSFVGHEVRNPLAVIHGFGSTIQERWAGMPDEQKLDLIRRMTANAIYLEAVLSNVMQIRAGVLAEGSVRTSVEETAPLIKGVAVELAPLTGGRELEVEVEEATPPMRVDTHRLRQVLTNLVVNAAKYSPTNTPVIIRARPESSYVLVTVSDEGPGIPAALREQVFDKFMQIERHSKGLGLGLYICRALMRAMDGDIWVGADGPGTTMCLRIPAAG
jgi:signal transduction histidine kinase